MRQNRAVNKLIPYLIASGSAEEALALYARAFGGGTVALQRYRETDYDVPPESRDAVAHAHFRGADGVELYVSDGFPGQRVAPSAAVALSVTFDGAAAQRRSYDVLREGGEVTLGFSPTSVGSTLATVVDRFGVHWYLNREE